MDINITKQTEQPLLNRKIITGSMTFERATPNYAEVKKELSKKLSTSEELIVIKNIYTSFGERNADFNAFVYNTADDLKRIEGQKKEAAKPAEQKKEGA